MIRQRTYGTDSPFMGWLRVQEESLPSRVTNGFAVTVNDVDSLLHCYSNARFFDGNSLGEKFMKIETKSRCGECRFPQIRTLSIMNLFAGVVHYCEDRMYENCGVFILRFSDTSPDDSSRMWWHVFPEGRIVRSMDDCKCFKIDQEMLLRILRFEVNPKTLV